MSGKLTSPGSKYINKVFKSKETAQEFCDKVNKRARKFEYYPRKSLAGGWYMVVGARK